MNNEVEMQDLNPTNNSNEQDSMRLGLLANQDAAVVNEDDEYIPPELLEEEQADNAFPPHIPAAANQNLNLNLPKIWRQAGWVVAAYFIPVTVALIVVLIIDYHKPCERPLKTWAIVQIVLQVVMLSINLLLLYKIPRIRDNGLETTNRRSIYLIHLLNRLVNFIWFGWFVIGMTWTFEVSGKAQCPKTAPNLYRMCFALIIIQIVVITLLILLCCCSCIILIIRLMLNPPDELHRRPRGASEETIQSLPTKKFTEGIVEKDHTTCAICLSEYEEEEELRFLPCNHHFHSKCVDLWLATNKSCPFCKRFVDEPNISSPV